MSRSTWGLIAILAVLLFSHLGSAPIWYGDEYRGAERAREFLVTGKLWTVQENFEPNFHKPPLHYWLTASTLRLLGEGKLAIRFWPQYLKDFHIDLTSHIATAQRFGASNIPADFLFILDGVEDESFLLFFGKLHQPVYDMPEARAVMISGTWHGLISSCDWPKLRQHAPGVHMIAGVSQVVESVRD